MQEEIDVVSSKLSKGNNWREGGYRERGDIGGDIDGGWWGRNNWE